MHYWIVKYWEGFHARRCLVVADDKDEALRLFLNRLTHLRSYNVRAVIPTTSKIFALRL